MAIVHVNLTEDSKCGFCGTPVKAGYSVCPNCGAMHGYKRKKKMAALPQLWYFSLHLDVSRLLRMCTQESHSLLSVL